VAREPLKQTPRHRWREQGFSGGDHANPRNEVGCRGPLQQEAACPCAQRFVDVLIELKRGQDDDARCLGPSERNNFPRSNEPALNRHLDVHQDDVGIELRCRVHCLGAIRCFTDNLKVRLGFEDQPKPGSHEVLVVGDQHANRHEVELLKGNFALTR
jgi:hypothetical protein